MKMFDFKWGRYLQLILLFCIASTYATSPTTHESPKLEIFTAHHRNEEVTTMHTPTKHRPLEELVKEQTEAIRRILAERKHLSDKTPQPPPPHTIPTNVESEKTRAEKERESIEALRQKCEHFFKFYRKHPNNDPKTMLTSTTTTTERARQTVQPFGPPIKPQFFHKASVHGDEIEAQGSEHQETKVAHVMKHKYVRLEPLVLQKSHLTNGKTLYYWYRHHPHTPSYVQIPDNIENQHVDVVAQPNFHNHPTNIPIPDQYKMFLDPITGGLLHNVHSSHHHHHQNKQPLASQLFINPHNGMMYQAAAPNQFIYHHPVGEPPVPTTTTTTTTTTPAPIIPEYSIEYTPESEEEALRRKFRHEFKFVIPIPIANMPKNDDIAKYPYAIDPFAYFPKDHQPTLMNVAVPYLPNFHTINALSIEEQQVKPQPSTVANEVEEVVTATTLPVTTTTTN